MSMITEEPDVDLRQNRLFSLHEPANGIEECFDFPFLTKLAGDRHNFLPVGALAPSMVTALCGQGRHPFLPWDGTE